MMVSGNDQGVKTMNVKGFLGRVLGINRWQQHEAAEKKMVRKDTRPVASYAVFKLGRMTGRQRGLYRQYDSIVGGELVPKSRKERRVSRARRLAQRRRRALQRIARKRANG